MRTKTVVLYEWRLIYLLYHECGPYFRFSLPIEKVLNFNQSTILANRLRMT